MSELNLKCFNKPISMIIRENQIVGYTELFLEDLFYNYMDSHGKLYFTDLTCYKYIPIQVDFLRKKFLQQNMTIMNNFLIGLLLFF